MKKFTLIVASVALSLGGPAYAQSGKQVLKGTAIGAGGGALVGAVVPGVSVGTGALVGAGAGALVTVIKHKNKKRHYRDSRGRKYYLNSRGRRVYD